MMYTSVVLVALSGLLAAPAAEDKPRWLTDYAKARKLCRNEEKPVAVVIGSGKEGWHQLSRTGKLGKKTQRLLAEKYVCLYVDASAPAGKELADVFRINDEVGLVISSPSGKLQAFRHEGDLENRDLARYLERYSDPDREVETTETNPAERTSNYYIPPPPMMFIPSFGGGGGRGC